MARPLSTDDLLAGASTVHKVEIPAALLSGGAGNGNGAIAGEVGLRALTLKDIQRVTQAAKENRVLTSVLLVQQAGGRFLVPPANEAAVARPWLSPDYFALTPDLDLERSILGEVVWRELFGAKAPAH